jgi:hypothetical protein
MWLHNLLNSPRSPETAQTRRRRHFKSNVGDLVLNFGPDALLLDAICFDVVYGAIRHHCPSCVVSGYPSYSPGRLASPAAAVRIPSSIYTSRVKCSRAVSLFPGGLCTFGQLGTPHPFLTSNSSERADSVRYTRWAQTKISAKGL